jgi:DNA-binding response OmpR family regulator
MRTIKILFVEDNLADLEIMEYHLEKAGIGTVSKCVYSKKDFLDELAAFKPEVVLCDYMLPTFNGMHAFKLFKEQNLSIPFILVTGALTEELALECLKEGVDEMVLKDAIESLPFKLNRSLDLKQSEKDLEEMLAELATKNEEIRLLHEQARKKKVHDRLSTREFEIFLLLVLRRSRLYCMK